MATRRNSTIDSSSTSKHGSIRNGPEILEKSSSVAPAVPLSVIAKLLGFTIAMFAGPISVYFLTLNTLYHGNPTWAGATAALTANIVLIAYVVVAMREDQGGNTVARDETRKSK